MRCKGGWGSSLNHTDGIHVHVQYMYVQCSMCIYVQYSICTVQNSICTVHVYVQSSVHVCTVPVYVRICTVCIVHVYGVHIHTQYMCGISYTHSCMPGTAVNQ